MFSGTRHQPWKGKYFRRPIVLESSSSGSPCTWEPNTWSVSWHSVHLPNDIHTAVQLTLLDNFRLCSALQSFRITYWSDWRNQQYWQPPIRSSLPHVEEVQPLEGFRFQVWRQHAASAHTGGFLQGCFSLAWKSCFPFPQRYSWWLLTTEASPKVEQKLQVHGLEITWTAMKATAFFLAWELTWRRWDVYDKLHMHTYTRMCVL